MNAHQGHRARKRFGQNFLHDPGVIQRIIDAVNPKPDDTLVEIGPGLGALTEQLLAAAGRLHVVELDRDLVARLQQRYAAEPNICIHSADALSFDFRTLGDAHRLRVVGNLPYNISTPLLFHLIDQIDSIRDIHCMLQKEVVDRICAGPGDNNYGRLSVMIQYHCETQHLFDVAASAFQPAPKVDSAILRLTPHAQSPVQVGDKKLFAQLVTQAFSQRRKTLRNSLKSVLSAEQIARVGVDPGARPETLSLDDFARLSDSVVTETE
ncbi:rRNA methyltransferase [Candidatus Tenderia electrophaga]|jgi:16S rRNA (adenine1518-N6/adenine1519-N6)-dimethyltransferase|uniref:Ribosomal RNA small subunit methyltransferase A n=1 Tax=Candidatus Tenderia electrophaga TaxID=1748243 RepID=A0A0S2TAC6_9GAMM|nr:rRNA methyltransferase [Candidatus Tenderia electrophaga]